MKVIVPIDENKDDVCIVFARAPYFLVYDTETSRKEFLENPAASAAGGAGIKAAQFVLDLKADALITVRLGENSAEVLKEASMKIYKTVSNRLEDNLTELKNGSLAELTQFHAGYHGRS